MEGSIIRDMPVGRTGLTEKTRRVCGRRETRGRKVLVAALISPLGPCGAREEAIGWLRAKLICRCGWRVGGGREGDRDATQTDEANRRRDSSNPVQRKNCVWRRIGAAARRSEKGGHGRQQEDCAQPRRGKLYRFGRAGNSGLAAYDGPQRRCHNPVGESYEACG